MPVVVFFFFSLPCGNGAVPYHDCSGDYINHTCD